MKPTEMTPQREKPAGIQKLEYDGGHSFRIIFKEYHFNPRRLRKFLEDWADSRGVKDETEVSFCQISDYAQFLCEIPKLEIHFYYHHNEETEIFVMLLMEQVRKYNGMHRVELQAEEAK